MNENHWLNEIFPDAENGKNSKKKKQMPSEKESVPAAVFDTEDDPCQNAPDLLTENEASEKETFSDTFEETKVMEIASEKAEDKKAETEEAKEKTEENSPENQDENEPALSFAGSIFDWVKTFLFYLVAVIFVFTLLFRGVTVRGDSMLPTLKNDQYLIISDLFYEPKCGDIIVARSLNYRDGKEPVIKRVIATEGQTVKINFKTWQVWVDGVLLQEDYIYYEPGFMMATEDMIPDENFEKEITVNENCVFVMGDHRNDSLDSRSKAIGQIDTHYIMDA